MSIHSTHEHALASTLHKLLCHKSGKRIPDGTPRHLVLFGDHLFDKTLPTRELTTNNAAAKIV